MYIRPISIFDRLFRQVYADVRPSGSVRKYGQQATPSGPIIGQAYSATRYILHKALMSQRRGRRTRVAWSLFVAG